MIKNVIETILYSLMTVIYVIADKQYLLKPALVGRSLHSVRRRPVER
jgi:hypothetical protein